jgi:hypothetical protein
MVTFLRLGEFFDEPRRKREFAIPAIHPGGSLLENWNRDPVGPLLGGAG